jgi:hypothetical protein
MHIEVSTDSNIKGSAELTRQVEAVVEAALDRFRERITAVGVFLSDENSGAKRGDDDKRCVMEARPAGLQPIAVSHRGATLDQAIEGAADTLEKTLKRTLGRLDDPTGRTSFGGDQTI